MVRRCNPRRPNRGTSRSRHIIKNSPLIGAAGAIGAIIGPIGGLAGIASFVGVVMKGIEIREGSAHRLATQYEESINHINEHLVRESTPDEFVTSTYLHSIERVWQHDKSYRSDVPLLATFVGKLANSSQPDTQNGVRHDVQKIIDMLGNYNSTLCDDKDDRRLQLANAVLPRVSMRFSTTLECAYMRQIKARGADMREANLRGVVFEEADLLPWNTDSSHIIPTEFTESRLDWAWLKSAKLDVSCFQNVSMSHVMMHKASINNAIFRGADLRYADLSETVGTSADFRYSLLYHANLTNAHLEEANFCSADLRGAKLEGAHLEDANLTNANLRGVGVLPRSISGACSDGGHQLDSAESGMVTLQRCSDSHVWRNRPGACDKNPGVDELAKQNTLQDPKTSPYRRLNLQGNVVYPVTMVFETFCSLDYCKTRNARRSMYSLVDNVFGLGHIKDGESACLVE